MSEFVPEGWSVNKLSDICNIVGGGTPERAKPEYWGGDIPWVSPTEVTSLKSRYITKTKEKITDLGLNKSSAKLHPKGTVLMTSRASIGYVAINTIPVTTNQGFQSLQCRESINNEYLYQHISWIKPELEKLSAGSTFSEISSTTLKGIQLTYPPLPEQQKITAILTSVDEVIEKTQTQINKLKDLKTGMMQELLTRGIGVDGKPHTEFKDSPVGIIPKGWEVELLGTLASFVTSGSRGWAQYYSKSGAIFIRIGNLTREHINFRFKDTIFVTPPNSAEGKRTLVQTGDVLISITADLGVIAVVNDDIGEAYVNQHVSLVRLKDKNISRWIGHFLSFEESQKQFTANNDAGAKAGLNLTAIRNTLIALPTSGEMQTIVKSLDSVDQAIAMKRKRLLKITDTKKALMQDLLTGKVRVKVDS